MIWRNTRWFLNIRELVWCKLVCKCPPTSMIDPSISSQNSRWKHKKCATGMLIIVLQICLILGITKYWPGKCLFYVCCQQNHNCWIYLCYNTIGENEAELSEPVSMMPWEEEDGQPWGFWWHVYTPGILTWIVRITHWLGHN